MNESGFPAKVLAMKTLAERIKHIRKLLKLTQEKYADAIAAKAGVPLTRGAVNNWEHGGGIERHFEQAICEIAECSLDWLANGKGSGPDGSAENVKRLRSMLSLGASTMTDNEHLHNLKLVQQSQTIKSNSVPIYGARVMGMDGEVVFKGGPISHVSAITVLEHDAKAYAFYVPDNSMKPKAKAGDIGWAYPSRPAPDGSHVLIRMTHQGTDEDYGIFRLLVEARENELIVATYNPAREYAIPRNRIKEFHHVRQVTDG